MKIFIHEDACQYVVYKVPAILPRLQCGKLALIDNHIDCVVCVKYESKYTLFFKKLRLKLSSGKAEGFVLGSAYGASFKLLCYTSN